MASLPACDAEDEPRTLCCKVLSGRGASAGLKQRTAARRASALFLSERRLVEGAQLARVQARALGPQQLHRLNADLQMLGDRAFVETVGLSRQLDLAVQRLVRHAQQRPVRHAEA